MSFRTVFIATVVTLLALVVGRVVFLPLRLDQAEGADSG